MRFAASSAVVLALFLNACKSGGSNSKAAIQTAIEQHLRKQPNVMLNNMTLEVRDVKFEGEKAKAEVKFRSKQSPDLAVGVRYVLRKAGDHWEVESSSPSGGMGGHGQASAPHASPPPSGPALQPSH
jgi:hypothetical protein